MRGPIVWLPLLVVLGGSAPAQPAATAAPESFQSIELRAGGIVTVRYGPHRGMTVLGVNPGRPIRAVGDRLVIDRCDDDCPRGSHRIEVEVVTPAVSRLAVADGGRIEVRGDFPSQASVATSVISGGTIDIRSLEAAQVTAAIEHGGRILARPGRGITATVSNGGNVTYWGDASVTSSARDGGVVERGDPADLGRSVAQIDDRLAPPPVAALVPPTPPRSVRKH